jgi:NADH:ubiquinone oxidoreductase subunit 6 (subunit J)
MSMSESFLHTYWPLLLPLVLGGAAIYWLLPQPRRSMPLIGAVLGGMALVGVAVGLARSDADLAEAILFYAFAALAVVAGALLVTQQNPVHGALSFAVVVLSTCGLFLLQGAPFLMAATTIVYAGAIIVTFLFVIMLAQQSGLANADQRSREPFLATVAGFLLLAAVLVVLQRTYDTRQFDVLLDKVDQVARATTREEVFAILGDPDRRPAGTLRLELAEALEKHFPEKQHPLLATAEERWDQKDVEGTIAQFRKIQEQGRRLRAQQGILRPEPDLKLSPFAGTPPNENPRELPAANVAGLGTTLFTDHLLAVELAGTLLLVAAIGAVAIASRRKEVER